jgi:hypothetical protein
MPHEDPKKVYIKSIIFWEVTPCSLLSFNRRFGGTYRLYLQACHLLTCWFLLKLFLRPWRWKRNVPPKRWLQHSRLHGVTSQKMILFIFFNFYTFQLHEIKFFSKYFCLTRLLTESLSLSLNSVSPRYWPVSHSVPLHDLTTITLHCLPLSIKTR